MGSAISTTLNAFPPLRDILLPTPEAYVTILNIFQYFPLVTILQWLTSWHPAGKTSYKNSRLNIPGRLGWFVMEIFGPINLLYILYNLPARLNIQSLPLPNKLAASLYLIHYLNRAIISPFFAAPSMSPMHVVVPVSAMFFNWFNSTCLAGWLVGYTVTTIPGYYPTSSAPSSSTTPQKLLEESLTSNSFTSLFIPTLGLALFILGMAGNIHAERTLFRLRREEADKASHKKESTALNPSISESSKKYSKIYVIPPAQGIFTSILYPHYAFEWLEWTGFALVGTAIFPALSLPPLIPSRIITSTSSTAMAMGSAAPPLHLAPWITPFVFVAERLRLPVLPLPAIVFVVNAVANMLPHARWGRKWYVERFGEGKVAGRGAVVPFCSWL